MWNKKSLNDYEFLIRVGIILLVIGAGLLGWNCRLLIKGQQIMGTVVEIGQDVDGGFSPLIVYYKNGKRYTHQPATYLNPPAFKQGEKVLLYVDPQNPSYAVVNGYYDLIAGFVSAFIGFIILTGSLILYRKYKRKKKLKEWVKINGKQIEADILRTEIDYGTTINNEVNPYMIYCQWYDPVTNKEYVFMSDYIWYDPSEFLADRSKISVRVDPDHREIYWVDISFLPDEV